MAGCRSVDSLFGTFGRRVDEGTPSRTADLKTFDHVLARWSAQALRSCHTRPLAAHDDSRAGLPGRSCALGCSPDCGSAMTTSRSQPALLEGQRVRTPASWPAF